MTRSKVETLEERYRDDPVLLELYKEKLLIRGWAGVLKDYEREYIARMNPPWYATQVEKARKMREKLNKPPVERV